MPELIAYSVMFCALVFLPFGCSWTVVFLLCGLPLGFFWFLVPWINRDFSVLDYILFQTSLVLTSVNSCANPIIYFFVGSFRHRLKHQTLKMVLQSALQDTPETPENMVEMSRSKAEP